MEEGKNNDKGKIKLHRISNFFNGLFSIIIIGLGLFGLYTTIEYYIGSAYSLSFYYHSDPFVFIVPNLLFIFFIVAGVIRIFDIKNKKKQMTSNQNSLGKMRVIRLCIDVIFIVLGIWAIVLTFEAQDMGGLAGFILAPFFILIGILPIAEDFKNK